MAKVLIIKLGYSETIDPEISRYSSLGDVLRTTIILHHYKNDHVTWLVDEAAYELLEGNEYIDRILIYDLTAVLQLQRERFDTVVNLEKVPGVCALADSINAWRRFGFRFEAVQGVAEGYDGCEEIFALVRDNTLKKIHRTSWQEHLLKLIGAKWEKQEYILGYKPKSEVEYDIGLNWLAGKKWPNKSWPKEYWEKLITLISPNYSYSWQEGRDNLHHYIEWINKCKVIITNDSLGLHIALALKKQMIVLVGPTNHSEVYLYERGSVLCPDIDRDCMPCLVPKCKYDKNCMYYIAPERVKRKIDSLLGEAGKQ